MTTLRKQRDELVKALNGFIWLGNNLDNIHKPLFREMYEACLVDAKAAKALSDWDGSGVSSSPTAMRGAADKMGEAIGG